MNLVWGDLHYLQNTVYRVISASCNFRPSTLEQFCPVTTEKKVFLFLSFCNCTVYVLLIGTCHMNIWCLRSEFFCCKVFQTPNKHNTRGPWATSLI